MNVKRKKIGRKITVFTLAITMVIAFSIVINADEYTDDCDCGSGDGSDPLPCPQVWVDAHAPLSWYDFCHVATIQTGVDRVTPYGTVTVYDGIYYENYARCVRSSDVNNSTIVPDTGQDLCYDWENLMDECPGEGEDFYGQDGSYTINPPDLTDNGDGTVTDNLTALMWEQKTEENEPISYTYDDAITYCDDLTLGNHNDWSIPTRGEYSTILN